MKPRFTVIPTVHLFLKDGSKILLLRRYNTGFADGNYSVIAGHLDGNETATEAMIREAKEEGGITPKDLNIIHVSHRKCPTVERVDFFFTAKSWDGTPKNMEPNKCDELRWCELSNLPENTIPYIRQAIALTEKGIFYSEYGW